MTRIRPLYTWLAFLLCLGAVGGALVWMSATMLRLERVEADNKREARQAENERLALWRMETALVPLIAQENARPSFAYRSFYTPSELFSNLYSKVPLGEIKQPSELLSLDSPYILLHFEVSPRGKLTSPQIPTSNDRDVAEANEYTTFEKIDAAEKRLKQLRPVLTRARLLAALAIPNRPAPQPPPQVAQNAAPNAQNGGVPNAQGAQQSSQRNAVEYQKRQQASTQVLNEYQTKSVASRGRVNPMKAVWLGEHLLLVREARIEGRQLLQGCVLNWLKIQSLLQAETKDLLPDGRVVPVKDARAATPQLMLASIPVRLVTSDSPASELAWFTPTRTALGISWLCFLLSATAVAFLLRAALLLSERRGAFVSAVTHELRTPLTTFRLYTEMLNRGMVDEDGSREYLDTLHREAERLGHLVENVLSYARLESPKKRPASEEFDLHATLERMRDTLSRRTTEAEMKLAIEPDTVSPVRVRCDAAAVERIVFNLVDNACKYARSAEDRRIEIECRANGKFAELRVRDHGPGVAPNVAKRIFRPFDKTDREAANTAPGVGLGLSLSRRLARSMGGDLSLDADSKTGATFVLTMPLCAKQ